MAGKKLDIKIGVDYSEIDALEKRLKNIAVDIDDSKLKDLGDKLDSFSAKDINIGIDISGAKNQLDKLESQFKEVKSRLEDNINLKINVGELKGVDIKSALDSGKELSNTNKGIEKLGSDAKETQSNVSDLTNAIKTVNRVVADTNSEMSKATEKKLFSNMDVNDLVNDLSKIHKEIGRIEQQSVGKSSQELEVMQTRVKQLRQESEVLNETLKNMTGKDFNDSKIGAEIDNVNKYKVALKEAGDAAKEQAKQVKAMFKEVDSLLEKEISARNNAIKNENLGNFDIAKQFRDVEREARTARMAISNVNGELKTLYQNNDGSKHLIDQKLSENARQAANDYKELQGELKQIFNLQKKISALQAQEDAGVISGRDQIQLNALKDELDIRKKIYETKKQTASQLDDKYDRGNQSRMELEMAEQVTAELKQQADAHNQIQAQAQQTVSLYKQLENSMKQQSSYQQKLDNGNGQESDLRELISLEERRQQTIRQTLDAQGRGSSVYDAQISDLKQALELQERLNRESNFGGSSRGGDGVFGRTRSMFSNVGFNIDLMDVVQESKQAAMAMFDVVATMDAAMIDIKKVVDAPKAEFDAFEQDIYDLASNVGKAADEYAVSVERWATAGHSLQESIELAQQSTIGSFIGNIDEAAMVDYMAVPLNAYKESGLEVQDVLNVMNETANQNAIEMDDLGAAYKRAASTASATGTSFQELTAMTTVAMEATRLGGETIGTALKGFDVNLGKINSQITSTDEKKFERLASYGIDLRDSNGELRSTYDILGNVKDVWGSLNSEQRADASFAIAGKQYQNIFTSIIGGWEDVIDIQDQAMNQTGLEVGQGSAYEEYAKQQESIGFKIAELDNAWKKFIQTLSGGKGVMMDVLDWLIDKIEMLTDLAESGQLTDWIKNIVKGFAAFAALKFTNNVASDIANLIDTVGDFKKVIGGLDAGSKLASVGKAAGMMGKAFGVASPYILGAAAAFGALDLASRAFTGEGIITNVRNVMTSFDELETALNDLDKIQADLDSNMIITGELQLGVESYESIEDEIADKLRNTEVGVEVEFSDEEFVGLQQKVANLIETFDLDPELNLEFNNFDDIMSKLSKIKDEIDLIKQEELSNLFGSAREANDVEEPELKPRKLTLNNWGERVKATYDENYTPIYEYDQGEVDKANEVIAKRIEIYKTASDEIADLVKNMDKLELTDAFASMSDQDKELAIPTLAKSVGELKQQVAEYEQLGDKISNITDKTEGLDAFISNDDLEIVRQFGDQYSELGNDVSKWSDTERKAVAELLTKHEELNQKISQHVDEIARATGASEEQINKMSDAYSKMLQGGGGTDYLKQLLELDQVTAHNEFGVTADFKLVAERGNISTDELLIQVQQDVDAAMASNELSSEALVKMNIVTEEGQVNAKTIGLIEQIPREVSTHYKIINDDGSLSEDYLTGMSELLTSFPPEIASALKIETNDGVATLESVSEAFEKIPEKDREAVLNYLVTGNYDEIEGIIDGYDEIDAKEDELEIKIHTAYEEGGLEEMAEKFNSIEDTDLKISADARDAIQKMASLQGMKAEFDSEGNIIKFVAETEEAEADVADFINEIAMENAEFSIMVSTEDAQLGLQNVFDKLSEIEGADKLVTIDAEVTGEDIGTFTEALNELPDEKKMEILTNLNMESDSSIGVEDVIGKVQEMLSSGDQKQVDMAISVMAELFPGVENPGEVEEAVKEETEVEDIKIDVGLKVNGEVIENNTGEVVRAASEEEIETGEVSTDTHIIINGEIVENNTGEVIRAASPEEIETGEFTVENKGTVKSEIVSDNTEQVINEAVAPHQTGSQVDVGVNVNASTTGGDAVTVLQQSIDGVAGQHGANLSVTSTGAEQVSGVRDDLEAAEGSYVSTLDATLGQNIIQINSTKLALEALNGMVAIVAVSINDDQFVAKVSSAKTAASELNNMTATPKINGNKSGFDSVISSVDQQLSAPRSMTVAIKGDATGFFAALNNVLASRGSVSIGVKGVKASTAITANAGSAFSTSINGGGTNASSSIGGARNASTSSGGNKRINEDVWRYWGKQLYTGNSLENQMSSLENSIKQANENQDKLINLYGKQIKVIDKQIAYEQSMQSSYQAQMNSLLSQLRGKGFKTSGNNITNLDRAKAFKGDAASDVESLLNDWKSVYESLQDSAKKINDLRTDKWEKEQDILEAKTARELEKIESRLKQTNVLLRKNESNLDLVSTKLDAINDADFELLMTINAEGANTASRDLQGLMSEFNKLSVMNIQYAENAEELQGTLEDLRDSILNSADAIIEYRQEIEQIKLDRAASDYERYTSAIEYNTDALQSNIDAMRDGLISGQKLTDLNNFIAVDLSRDNSYTKLAKSRIELEQQVNDAMAEFADMQVDRTKKKNNRLLQLDIDRYNQLVKMEQDFASGKFVDVEAGRRGLISAETSAQEKQYEQWKNKLNEMSYAYTQAYSKMLAKQQAAMDATDDAKLKQEIYSSAIIEQLKYQEKMYEEIIKTNNEYIKLSENMLASSSLTTSQRQELIDQINEYKESNMDAQEAIRDSIEDRFDYEFSLYDKAAKQAEKYTEELQHIMEVAEFSNISPETTNKMYEAVLGSIINQYGKAKDALQKYNDEQSKFEQGSLEWNLLGEQIDSVKESIRDLSIEALNTNKDMLENTMDAISEKFTKGLLDGKTLDEWESFRDNWVTGVEKEMSLEGLRQKSISLENEAINNRLEMLDRQEQVSKKDIEYTEKQMELIELQNKLRNIENERNVQTIVRNDDGTWDWAYVADQTEYDKTYEDMNDAQKELTEYQENARLDYVKGIKDIMDKAANGEYATTEDMQKDLLDLNQVYGGVLSQIPGFNMLDSAEAIEAYGEYLGLTKSMTDDILGLTNEDTSQMMLNSMGEAFESAFDNTAQKLGTIIGQELLNALSTARAEGGVGTQYNISNISLPNVTDGEGFANFFRDLPQVASQEASKK